MNTTPVSRATFMADNTNSKARKETKTSRKNFLVTPSIAELLATIADREGNSENDVVARAIRRETKSVPLFGEVPCGPLSEVGEGKVEAHINVGDLYTIREGDFLLRATGDSMIGDGILDGDLVLVRQQSRCDSGEIAVVLVDGPMGTTATLKKVTYSHDSPIVKLIPMNEKHQVIEIDTSKPGHDLRICGVKRGVIRAH